MTPWKTPGLTPDEMVYEQNAHIARLGFLESVRVSMRLYTENPGLAAFPSPLRWLWTWVTRWVGVGRMSFAGYLLSIPACVVLYMPGARAESFWVYLACTLPIAVSPLEELLKTRKLQDTTVGALTLAAIACAYTGHPIIAAAVCVALLCIKEAAVLMLPAVVLAAWIGGAKATDAWLIPSVLAGWLTLTRLVCGHLTWQVFRIARAGHATDYTRQHQSGMPHRLFVDLMLVSPLPLMAALISRGPLLAIAVAIVIAHTLAPVRNVRTVLAADLLLRAQAGAFLASHGWPGLVCALLMVGYDLAVSSRLRGLRDTPTQALAQAIGAVP